MPPDRLTRPNSIASFPETQTQPPAGPLSGPSSTTWRRQRLLNIGSSDRSSIAIDESTVLRPEINSMPSYGALPDIAKSQQPGRSKLHVRRGFTLPGINIPRGLSMSTPHTPVDESPGPSPFRRSRFSIQRPISAYDQPLPAGAPVGWVPDESEAAVKTNGIRVWYSSFTSIDWLHDSIKDTARQARLRRRKSRRGKLRRELDRSIGWLVVSIVGFLTAIIAFMIVRSEQLLFDLKTGYCTDGWLRSKRFCCPVVEESASRIPHFLSMRVAEDDFCPSWALWGDVFGPAAGSTDWIREQAVEWVAYTVLAVCMRTLFAVSCISDALMFCSSLWL